MTTGVVDRARRVLRPGGRLRRAAPVAALGWLLVVMAVLFARTPSSELPLDPRSSEADGTRALTLVLRRLGAELTVLDEFPIVHDFDVVLVLVDNVGPRIAERIRDHVRAGGTLVVTDPGDDLSPNAWVRGPANPGVLDGVIPRACDLPALEGAPSVRVGRSSVLRVPGGAAGCYRRDADAWLVVESLGTGTLVTTGGPAFLTNSMLGEADNAVLAAALLAPEPGTRLAILSPDFTPPDASAEPTSLLDLVPLSLRLAGLQLLVAFVVYVAWRSRRLGRPLQESPEVRLPGSELVVAVGNLFQRTDARPRAAELVRDDLRRTLAERLGLPDVTDAHTLATTAASRTAVSAAEVEAILSGPPPADTAQLIALAQRADAVRRAVLVPVATGAARADSE